MYHYYYIQEFELKDEYYYAGDNAESKRIMNQTFEMELEQLVNDDLPRIPALLSDVFLSRGLTLDPFVELYLVKNRFAPYQKPSITDTMDYRDYDMNAIFTLHNMQKTLNESVTYFTALGEAELLPR